jgi:glycosyltransferase involved in cell wall biosynthesis
MNPSCATHIMRRLAVRNKVLYINPFSSDLRGVSKNGSTRGLAQRLTRKTRSLLRCLQHPEKNLYVYSPVFLPVQGKSHIDRMNNTLLTAQLDLVCRHLGITKPLFWMENIRAADLLDRYSPNLTVYHVSDLFTDCPYTADRDILRQREQKITRKSDLLICVSHTLFEMKATQHPRVYYLPHGVDFEKFRAASQEESTLEELREIPKPRAGYFGTMTAQNDIELMYYCARCLSHVSFVFAGQVTAGDYSELARLPNVFLLGKLPYEKIPTLCAGFDVCMLQWKMNDWIKSCNPLKLFEYMASGRPIVSIPIPEVAAKYGDVISIAHTQDEFAEALVREIENDTPERAHRRIQIAAEHSWDNNVEKIIQMINEAGNRAGNIMAG